MDDSSGANLFLEEQLKVFKGKLENAENAIIDFRQKQGVYFSTDEAADINEIKEYARDIEEISLDINSNEARKERLQKQLASVSSTVDVLEQPDGGNRLVELGKRLKTLQLHYTDKYPEVVRVRAEMASLQAQADVAGSAESKEAAMPTARNPLYQSLQQQLFEIDAEIGSLNAKKVNLENRRSRKERELYDVPVNKKELSVLVQERDSYRQIYQELLGRMGQSEVSRQMEIGEKAATFRVVDPAIFPETPISPNMSRLILLAIVAGLCCGFGTVVALDTFDMTIRDSGQLEAMGVEVLAVIPSIVDGQKRAGTRRFDYLVYGVSGIYCSGFFGLLLYELMNHFK